MGECYLPQSEQAFLFLYLPHFVFHPSSLMFQVTRSLGSLLSHLRFAFHTLDYVAFEIRIRREKSGWKEDLRCVGGCVGEKMSL